MKNFNWEEFKEGGVAVHCPTKDVAENFLIECEEKGFMWQFNKRSPMFGAEEFIYNQYKNDTSYNLDVGEVEFGKKQYYKEDNFKIIEWEIDKMEKKVYKIQDLYGDDFVEKKFRIANNGDFDKNLYEITKQEGSSGLVLYEMIDSHGVDISNIYNLNALLKFEFELVEEETKEIDSINKDLNVYIAGSLFNQGEVSQRKSEEELLRQNGYKNIYNPINAPCNNKEDLPTSADIFWGDTEEILDSELVIADLSNATDLGVACELGVIWACNHLHFLAEEGLTIEEILDEMKKKKLVAHLSDIRKGTAHQYRGNGIPVGFNQYMIGLVEDIGVIKDNFKEVLEELEGDK